MGRIDASEWISQTEASRIRGVSKQAISRLVSRGRLRTIVVGGHKLVKRADILDFKREKPGRAGGGSKG